MRFNGKRYPLFGVIYMVMYIVCVLWFFGYVLSVVLIWYIHYVDVYWLQRLMTSHWYRKVTICATRWRVWYCVTHWSTWAATDTPSILFTTKTVPYACTCTCTCTCIATKQSVHCLWVQAFYAWCEIWVIHPGVKCEWKPSCDSLYWLVRWCLLRCCIFSHC